MTWRIPNTVFILVLLTLTIVSCGQKSSKSETALIFDEDLYVYVKANGETIFKDRMLTPDELKSELMQIFEQNNDKAVLVIAEYDSEVSSVMDVQDLIRSVGFESRVRAEPSIESKE